MTFTNQEVPTWEVFQEQTMYDLNLPEVLDTQTCYPDDLNVKIEDPYSAFQVRKISYRRTL